MATSLRRWLLFVVPVLLLTHPTGSRADSIHQPCEGVVFVKNDDGSWTVLYDGATLVDKGNGNYQIWDVGAKSEHSADITRSDLLNMYCKDASI